jgi:hypothetical protein
MAKKENSEKKTKQKKEPVRYDPFIETRLREIILENKDMIKDICVRNAGIEPMSLNEWKMLDEVVLKVLKASTDYGWKTHYFRMEYLKRATPYSLANKVREKEMKAHVAEWISRMENDTEEQWIIHCCYQVFTQIAVWLGENCKVEKAESPED